MNREAIVFMLLLLIPCVRSQEKIVSRFAVTYIASSVIYIDGGRNQSVAIGDTLTIVRDENTIGRIVVTAVSRKSSAASFIGDLAAVRIGDGAIIERDAPPPEDSVRTQEQTLDSLVLNSSAVFTKRLPINLENGENMVAGRIALQYNGIIAEDPRFTMRQPGAVMRMDVNNLYGTGMVLSLYMRSVYEAGPVLSRFGNTSRWKNRIYEISLQNHPADASFGYGIGRMTSRFVGGLGTFDGFQVFYSLDDITLGIVGGAQVVDRSFTLENDASKASVFMNYHGGEDMFHSYDGTVAFGRQMVGGNLDREFLYTQHTLSMGTEFSLYGSGEFELQDITNGVRSSSFRLSNTFLSANYIPVEWCSLNFGFDASRSIYLFETMKSLSDTLFDRNILQGYRGSATFRLPSFVTISLNGAFRTKKDDLRDAYTLGGMLHASDILATGIGAGARYTTIRGVFSDGKNMTVDLERGFMSSLSVSLRYDLYRYTIQTSSQNFSTQTYSVSMFYRISQLWYSLLSADKVNDAAGNSERIFVELGMRF